MLKIKNLTVAFGNQEVLKNISLNIKNGEIVDSNFNHLIKPLNIFIFKYI